MTTVTATIAEFLLARLAEDEAAAKAALGPANSLMGDDAADEVLWMARNEGVAEAGVLHYSRHDPAYVLADIEAKRHVVEVCAEAMEDDADWDRWEDGSPFMGEHILKTLAQPYRDHPDWRAEWDL